MTRRRTLLVAALVAVALLVASPVLRGQVVKAARQLYGSTLYVVGGGYIGGPVGIGTSPVAGAPATLAAGTGTATIMPAGVLTASATITNSPADTNENDLFSYTLPANTLSRNGDAVEVIVWGTTAANANNKTLKLYFGATNVANSPTSGYSGIFWYLRATVIRVDATHQRCIGDFVVTGGVMRPNGTSPAATLTGDVVIRMTGTSAVGGAGDIVRQGAIVRYLPAVLSGT